MDNAAVELKTLRMASNVSLRRVKEAVIVFLVRKITMETGRPRERVGSVIARWGGLITAIGGIDGVETIVILQVLVAFSLACQRGNDAPSLEQSLCAKETRYQALFGQLLAAFYQEDIVEEADVRAWHVMPESNGRGALPTSLASSLENSWAIGSRMIEQFDAQDTGSEESE